MKNLQGLLSFVESANAGSFTAAATKLGLSPAAVSKNVIRLEKQLQVRLFNRSTRHLRLTQEGEMLLSGGMAALRALDDAIAEVSNASGEPRGRVRISAGISFGRAYVLPVLPELARNYPALQVEVNLDNRPVDLVNEGFDISVRGGVIPDSSLVARRIARLPVVLVASPDYLKRKGVPESPEALVDHDLLGVRLNSKETAAWGLRMTESQEFTKWEPTARIWASDADSLVELALGGHGISEAGLHHVAPHLRNGNLKVLLRGKHDPGERELVLHYPHRQFLSARVRAVVEVLLAHYKRQSDLHLPPHSIPEEWWAVQRKVSD
ncbi:LysR family transcriptional regulator [Brevundimonas sp. 3P9-tot-E]|uniref:LysR family transcriptional regulator n=1 Tax=unclassified Brevundimonas TaxID=2622653 RepID=UPI0039A31AB6